MTSSPVRTTTGLESNRGGLSGFASLDGDAGDVPAVAQVAIDAVAAAGPSYVAILPRASELFARGVCVIRCTPGANTIELTAQAGDTVNGGASFDVTTEGFVFLSATNRNELRVQGLAAV
jgi:hypothetical protein